jgi:hypothetical protein
VLFGMGCPVGGSLPARALEVVEKEALVQTSEVLTAFTALRHCNRGGIVTVVVKALGIPS